MQMTPEARRWLDDAVKRILARHHLSEPERAGVHYELMSHVHGAAEEKASAAGRAQIDVGDLQAALLDMGGEAELERAFVAPLARPVERATFGRRFGALFIDGIIVILGLIALHTMIEVTLRVVADVTPPHDAGQMTDLYWWFPWGFHDTTLAPAFQAVYGVASAALVLGYFAWLEANDRQTPGKRAMELRVVRIDGSPMTYRESILRNVAKLFPPLFAIDALLGLVAFSKEKQRLSDRLAGTIVVRA